MTQPRGGLAVVALRNEKPKNDDDDDDSWKRAEE